MPLPTNDSSPSRILVIHTAFIGDIVLSTGLLSELRRRNPTAIIRFVTTPAGSEILRPNSWNLEFEVYDKRKKDKGLLAFLRLAQKLKQFRPQQVYCVHRSFRSSLLAYFTGAKISGFREGAGSWFFSKRVSRKNYLFEAEKNLALLDGDGFFASDDTSQKLDSDSKMLQETKEANAAKKVSPQKIYPHLEVPGNTLESVQAKLKDLEKFVVFSPSSVWATKRWPAESFGALAIKVSKELGLPVVLVGSKDEVERSIARRVIETSHGARVVDLTGATNLGELKAVLNRCEIVVSNDSSPLHIGLALGKKAVAIFGPTTKELGFFPYAPEGRSAVVEHPNLNCRPCGLHGHHHCPQGHFRCMLEVSVDSVFLEVKKLLCP